MPRPSSPGRSRSGTLRADRGGEGQLLDHLDVLDAGRAPVQLLRLAEPGRDPDPGPPAGTRWVRAAGIRRVAAHVGLPASRGPAEPGGYRLQRRPGAALGHTHLPALTLVEGGAA
jgi:hypothetical protein